MTFRRQTGVPCDIHGNPHFAVAKIARPNGENTRPIGENIRPRGLTVLTAGFIPTSGVFLQERRTWYIHTFLHMQIFEVKINALRSYVHYRFCHGEMDQGQNLLQICVSERDTWQLDGPISATSAISRYTSCEDCRRFSSSNGALQILGQSWSASREILQVFTKFSLFLEYGTTAIVG